MLNSEVIFLKIVTGTSDFGGNLLTIFQKKTKKRDPIFWKFTVGRGGQHNNFFFGLRYKKTRYLVINIKVILVLIGLIFI